MKCSVTRLFLKTMAGKHEKLLKVTFISKTIFSYLKL